MKWNCRKFSCIAAFSFFLISSLYPVTLLLNDGRLYSGDLLHISNEKVLLQKELFFFEINSSDIDILINAPSSEQDEKKLILAIETKKGKKCSGELIKSTDEHIYILQKNEGTVILFNYKEISTLYLTDSPDLKDILTKNEENIRQITIKSKEYSIDERFNNLLITLQLLNIPPGTARPKGNFHLDIFDPDFYDIFWKETHTYLGIQTKEIIWNLIENYYEKELILFNIYRDKKEGLNYKQEFLQQTRNEFFQRAKKIILSMPD